MTIGIQLQLTTKDANNLLLTLIIFELGLVFIYLLGPVLQLPHTLQDFFNLDGEATLPAWFSSMQLFLIGIVFLFSRNWPQSHQIATPVFLLFMGAGFIFLSMDEAAVFHERLTGVFEDITWWPRFQGKNGIWMTLYLIIAICFLVAGGKAIRSAFKTYPRQAIFIVSGFVVFLIGAIGFEILHYLFLEKDTFLYTLEVVFEEFFEMLGASLILYGSILCALQEPIPIEVDTG